MAHYPGEPGLTTWADGIDATLATKLDVTAAAATYAPRLAVNVADYASLKDAIAALPSTGGTVVVPIGRFPAGDWTYDTNYMALANVRIAGEKMPHLSANADRLEGGSIIYGRFNVFADGFDIENVGVDCGKYVIDTYYGAADTHTANHPLGGTWDAFAFAQPNEGSPLPARAGCHFTNLIGLTRDSQSVGHAVLMEGVDGGTADGIVGVCGDFGVVVKSAHMTIGTLAGWSAGSANVIIKADTYAACGHVAIEYVEGLTVPPNTAPWFTPAVAQDGLLLNPATASFNGPIQIGRVKVFGSALGLGVTGGGGLIAADVQIGEVIADAYTGSMISGLDLNTCIAMRFTIGTLQVAGAQQGIAWLQATSIPEQQIHIGNTYMTNLLTRGFNIGGYGVVRIDNMQMINTPTAYYIVDTARLLIGNESLTSVTTKWERTPPALSTGWANYGGTNSSWDVALEDYGVRVKGLLSAASGATGVIATLPVYLSPPETKRLPGYANSGGARAFALVGVDAGGNLTLNDGTAPAVGDYISVDGVAWPL